MAVKFMFTGVKVNRVFWGASTIYTMDNGDNHLGYAGVCTPKRID